MAQTITKNAKDIVKAAMSAVPAISAEEALILVGSPDHVFVDLRDGREQAETGIIAGAVASSRGMMEFHIDPESPAHKPEFNQDKTYVLYCASGGAFCHGGGGGHGYGAVARCEPGRRR